MNQVPVQDPPAFVFIPARVAAAMSFVQWAGAKESGLTNSPVLSGDTPRAGGDLDTEERATKKAALRVLSNYFNGEMDFTDSPAVQPERKRDDPPPGTLLAFPA